MRMRMRSVEIQLRAFVGTGLEMSWLEMSWLEMMRLLMRLLGKKWLEKSLGM